MKDWSYPALLENLLFMRLNGLAIFLYWDYEKTGIFYLTKDELRGVCRDLSIEPSEATSFAQFKSRPENEHEDYYSWGVIEDYEALEASNR